MLHHAVLGRSLGYERDRGAGPVELEYWRCLTISSQVESLIKRIRQIPLPLQRLDQSQRCNWS
eukprot:scaffold3305_cov74-Skeletonema_dohrnii-CCMP3373.AAC.5